MSTISVHALTGGSITLPERFFITPSDPDAKTTVPSLCFLIQHTANNKLTRIVFDLGLRRDTSLYPKVLQDHCANRQPMTTLPDVTASLGAGGITVDEIDYVILSHVHYDHIGLPSDFSNPKTKFIVGPGGLDLLEGRTKLYVGSHSFFEAGILPLDRSHQLPPTDSAEQESNSPELGLNQTWQQLTPFPKAIDLFSDGTVYVVSAPGHLPGHINLLCRIEPDKYVLLAGDACHDVRLFTGERDIATWTDDEGRQCCIHADIAAAKETIKRLAQVAKEGIEVDGNRAEVEVVFAHNWEWEADAKRRSRFWPGKL